MRVASAAQSETAHDFPHYGNLVTELEIVHPEHIWVSDITYIRLGEGFVYLAVLMDVFTCGFSGWHLGHFLDQIPTLQALDQVLVQRTPQIHHSDKVVQYAATAYTARFQTRGTQIGMVEVGAAWQNGYAHHYRRGGGTFGIHDVC